MRAGEKVLILVLALVLAGSYFLSGCSRNPSTPVSAAQEVEVKRGTLETTISASGSLTIPHQSKLSFGTSGGTSSTTVRGTIKEMNVGVGDAVKKGQVLARLDTSSLERAILQAEASVRSAELALDNVQNPYKDADVVAAEAGVVSARASLTSAEQALYDARNPYKDKDILQAEASVVSARVTLQNNETDLSRTLAQHPQDIGRAETAVTIAQDALGVAQQTSASTQQSQDKAVNDAQAAVKTAQDAHTANLQTYFQFKPVGDTLYVDPAVMFGGASVPLAVQSTYRTLLQARDAFQSAQSQRETALSSAQAAVVKAEDTLKKAQEDLETLRSGTDPADIALKKLQVEQARINLAQAQANLAEIKKGADTRDVATKEVQLENAKANLAKAQASLAEIKKGGDALEVAAKNAQLAVAQASLDQAKEDLAGAVIVAPFDGGVVAAVNGEVGDLVGSASAVIITLVNPALLQMEGVADEVDIAQVRVGQQARVSLDALPSMQVTGRVKSIAPLATTQSGVVSYAVTISLESLGQASGGTTRRQSGASGQRTSGQAGSAPQGGLGQLKSGMTATAEIVTASGENVLLVPNQALTRQGGTATVKVLVNGIAEERQVRVGRSNDTMTEIVSGVSEGDKVLVEPKATRTPQVRTPSGGGILPGGIR